MSSWDAIFFDFDGVLAESADIKTEAFRTLYAPYGAKVVAGALDHHRAHGGVSRRKKIRWCHKYLLGRRLSEDELEQLAQHFSRLVEDAVVESAWVAGARDALQRLHGRLPMFVISGTPNDELRRIVGRRRMTGYFVEVHGSPPSKVPIIRDLLERYDLAADRVLFVGDSTTDYDAARATGVPFLGRVAPGDADPFPAGTAIVSDLTELNV